MKRLLPFLCLLLLLSGCSHRNYPTEAGDTGKWYFPLPGAKVISPYGQRDGKRHTGVDLKTKNKDKIFAAFDGEVVFSGTFSGYGNLVRIKHANGLETYYAHNSKNLVKQGRRVLTESPEIRLSTSISSRALFVRMPFAERRKALSPNNLMSKRE